MADKFQTHQLQIPSRLAGMRLDQALALLLPEYSRSRLKGWIEAGRVSIDRRQPRPRDLVSGGERVAVEAEIATDATVAPQAIELDLIHEDRELLIVNKPAGLVVHPGAGNRDRTLQNALLHFDPALAALPRAGILHRLDKDTTGLLAVARTLAAHTELTRQMQQREVEREYEAICSGVMTAGGTVDRPIGRHRSDRVRMAVREDGRDAITHYRVVARFRAHTHVRVSLETGRTHQIRVHFAHLRHPLVGDRTYGGRLLLPRGATAELVKALREFPRQALHAGRLKLRHPQSGERVEFQAPLPADLRGLLAVLRKDAAEQGRA
ncbi:MAG TPA: 23S rRNA pseudouridine(1911/1915/1917) synthase RluD [Steroidobacteraceae bacterium]|jgi:23S rRNA pseudouridine1911/1915/1917 synthase